MIVLAFGRRRGASRLCDEEECYEHAAHSVFGGVSCRETPYQLKRNFGVPDTPTSELIRFRDDFRVELSAAHLRRIDAVLRASADLQVRLAALRKERETIEAVKDSFAIRLLDAEEERILSKAVGRLGESLGAH